ncbi:MAG: hypothetical protein WC410_01520 [Candidatus Paceibacterota bacterium]|nr:hypothetical protein [Candidatus Paceibacterota bacterium]MDD5555533.1 hypothetical protein [Candidatus Paceibacterota bacterium]
MDIKSFAKKRGYLFWYVKDPEKLSKESIIEHVLNYGDWKDFRELVAILGVDEIAEIFRKQAEKERNNYRPKIKNYFEMYFNEYAPRGLK